MDDIAQSNRNRGRQNRHKSRYYSRSSWYSAKPKEKHFNNKENIETKEKSVVETHIYTNSNSGSSRSGYHHGNKWPTEQKGNKKDCGQILGSEGNDSDLADNCGDIANTANTGPQTVLTASPSYPAGSCEEETRLSAIQKVKHRISLYRKRVNGLKQAASTDPYVIEELQNTSYWDKIVDDLCMAETKKEHVGRVHDKNIDHIVKDSQSDDRISMVHTTGVDVNNDDRDERLDPSFNAYSDWDDMLESLCSADTENINKYQTHTRQPEYTTYCSKEDLKSNSESAVTERVVENTKTTHMEESYCKRKHTNKLQRKQAKVKDTVCPDATEVFKYLVKEMTGLCSLEDINELTTLFRECDNTEEWFRRRKNQFAIFERDKVILKVGVLAKNATYCLDYLSKKGCTLTDCTRYHICKAFITGDCSFQSRCKFSHDTMDDVNYPVSCRLGFSDVFNNEHVVNILALRFPRVCDTWNSLGYCSDTSCCKLHICQKYITGTCYQGDECALEHTFSLDQNQMVTTAYHMSNWSLPLLRKLMFVSKQDFSRGEKSECRGTCRGKSEPEVPNYIENVLPEDCSKEAGVTGTTCDQNIIRSFLTFPDEYKKKRNIDDDKFVLEAEFSTDTKHLCEKQLTDDCDDEDCPKIHYNKNGLPYIWQIKIYDQWLSLPEKQTVKIEQEFCGMKDTSQAYSLALRVASRNEMKQDNEVTDVLGFQIVFYPKIHTYTKYLYKDEQTKKNEARRISTPSYADGEFDGRSFKTCWIWFWVNDEGISCMFESDALQYTLEKKYLSGQKKYLYARENYRFKYCLDFGSMTQVNLDTMKSRKIFRRPMLIGKEDIFLQRFMLFLKPPQPLTLPLPEGWQYWDHAHPFELVELETSQDSYKECKRHFKETLHRPINHIYRVQNPVLWSAFITHKGSMEANAVRGGRKTNVAERMLFHGTDSLDSVRGIAINNFDHRLSGKNATVYGEGAYFATTAKYSHAYTRRPDRFMFLARVLIGEYTTGASTYKRPPSKPGTTHELYDSCVDNITNPSIFVVFDTKQYYPEFLIQYHSIEQASETSTRVSQLQNIKMKSILHPNTSTPLAAVFPKSQAGYPTNGKHASSPQVRKQGIASTASYTPHTNNISGLYLSTQPSQSIPNVAASHTLVKRPAPSPPVTQSTTSINTSTYAPTSSHRQIEDKVSSVSNITFSQTLLNKPSGSLPVTQCTTSISAASNAPISSHRQIEDKVFSHQTTNESQLRNPSVSQTYKYAYNMPPNDDPNFTSQTPKQTTTPSSLGKKETGSFCILQ